MPALKPEERRRVEAATAEVRQRTGVEVVVIVTRASDRYALYPLLWASLSAIVTMAILGLLFPRLPLRVAVLWQVIVLFALSLILDWTPLRTRLVPRKTSHSFAHALARREFAAHTMAGDPHRKLILLFVSRAEHYVEVIADLATHQAVAEGAWETIVADFTRAAKKGPLVAALEAAVTSCGAAAEDPTPSDANRSPEDLR
jgi:putative membrane protein